MISLIEEESAGWRDDFVSITQKHVAKVLANHTSQQGYIYTDFEELVAVFGPPLMGDGTKTLVEWVLMIDNVVITIYNWKTQHVPDDPYNWHVGGHSLKALEKLREIIPYCKITKIIVT